MRPPAAGRGLHPSEIRSGESVRGSAPPLNETGSDSLRGISRSRIFRRSGGRGWSALRMQSLRPLGQPLYAARTLPALRLNAAPGRKRPQERSFRSGYAELSRCRGISRSRYTPPVSAGFQISFVVRDSNHPKKWQFLGGCGPRGPATTEFQRVFCQVAGPHGWQRATAGRGAGRPIEPGAAPAPLPPSTVVARRRCRCSTVAY